MILPVAIAALYVEGILISKFDSERIINIAFTTVIVSIILVTLMIGLPQIKASKNVRNMSTVIYLCHPCIMVTINLSDHLGFFLNAGVKAFISMTMSILVALAVVKLSNKLTEDPVCLTAGEGISFEMEKVFANMPNQSPMPMKATRILEINPNHPIFETLKTLYASDKDKVKEVTEVLYDQACLIEGFAIKDPIAYSKKICELLVK